MNYWSDFRINWRAIVAATLGLSAGMSMNAYVNSVFGPYLIEAFGWSQADFALLGTFSLLTLFFIPLVGRLTDLYGVRRVAAVGIVVFPITCLILSRMTGDIRIFFAIAVVQLALCTSTTTAVYTRVVAQRFHAGRGLALAIAASGPAVAGGIGSPLMTQYIDTAGWRAGYVLLAGYSALVGAVTLFLLPNDYPAAAAGTQPVKRQNAKDYRTVVSSPVFWIMFTSAFLCSLPHTLAYSQIKVMLLEHGVTSTQAGFMVSVFAFGVLAGRLLSGIALDRLPAHWVAVVGMGLPAVGLFILATDASALLPIAMAVAFIGLSFGAEADILAYLVSRYFSMDIYGTVYGLLMAAVGGAITLGSALLSVTLRHTNTFSTYMWVAGVCVLIGSVNFLRVPRHRAPVQV